MIYQFSAGDVSTTWAYISGTVADFMPLILIILSISIALFVLAKVFHL